MTVSFSALRLLRMRKIEFSSFITSLPLRSSSENNSVSPILCRSEPLRLLIELDLGDKNMLFNKLYSFRQTHATYRSIESTLLCISKSIMRSSEQIDSHGESVSSESARSITALRSESGVRKLNSIACCRALRAFD